MTSLGVGKIGRTGIQVTALGFGAAPLGGFRGRISEREVTATLQAAVDGGVTLFDTAPFYGYGRSEIRIGHFLRDRPRASYVLCTKVGRWMQPFDRQAPPTDLRAGGLPFQPQFDYSAAGAARSLEQSTMRLGIPEIDIVYIHDVDIFTHGSADAADQRYREVMEGCYPALEALRAAGVIKAIGVGLNETERSLRFARDTDIDCILLAGRYTLLDQASLDGLLPLCREKGISYLEQSKVQNGWNIVGCRWLTRDWCGHMPARRPRWLFGRGKLSPRSTGRRTIGRRDRRRRLHGHERPG